MYAWIWRKLPGGLWSRLTMSIVMLAALYYEPLWIFYRDKATLTQIEELRYKRVAIGASAAEALSALIAPDNPDLQQVLCAFQHEQAEQVAARAERVISKALAAEGDAALFGHGHLLRLLAARWIGLEPSGGRLLALSTTSLSRLGYERETRVIRLWNQTS